MHLKNNILYCAFIVDLSLVNGDDDAIYLSANSLGLCPKNAKALMDEEFQRWQEW